MEKSAIFLIKRGCAPAIIEVGRVGITKIKVQEGDMEEIEKLLKNSVEEMERLLSAKTVVGVRWTPKFGQVAKRESRS